MYLERERILARLSSANLEVAPELLVESEQIDIQSHNGKLTVADVMTKDVVSVIDTMTIEQVSSIFNKRHISSVPVVNYHNKELIGIITMSDIIDHLFYDGVVLTLHEESNSLEPAGLALMDKKVSELMQNVTIQVSGASTIKEACALMEEKQIHQVLVTLANKVQGIFTAFDAVRILAKFDLKLD